MKTTSTLSILILLFLSSVAIQAQETYWKKTKLSPTSKTLSLQNLDKDKYQVFSLNVDAFKAQLNNAPLRTAVGSRSNVIVSFPDDKGKLERFRVVEAPVLSPAMSAQYPNIKTYLGFSMDTPGARIRFSVTPQGVQTMTSYLNKSTVFTVPAEKGNVSEYITYDRGVRIESKKDFECLTENEIVPIKDLPSVTGRDANDQLLRSFRIAVSTTGEYTNFWDDGNAGNGDAQADALAKVVATLNRNNEIFEVDMAVTFELVTGTEIIYPSAGSDPYTGSFNSQLQSTLTSVVGEANYDIGHLFTFGGNNGNAGCIGCVCVNGQKGSGFSSHSFTDNDGGAYMDDFFDVDYVPHEIGHQMGALHTHAAADNNAVNFEPGSGTTIMGYAGITGTNDVQDHSDPYFHYGSVNQILDNLVNRTCWTSTAITNNPPVADAGNDHTIPQGTAFKLTGTATDADGSDVVTFTWEQIDDGYTTRNTFTPTLTGGPLWRSRPPNTTGIRYMPILPRVISGQLTQSNPLETTDNSSWETVSTVSRTLNFALTARDRSEANGVGQFPQSDFDFMTVTVDGTSGPFAVTSQTTNESWDAGTTQTVTWDVAGTDGGAVNTPTVNIRLSTDGGLTFPVLVESDVVNDGSHDIVVPVTGAGDITTARLMIEGNDNIFFAVNSSNFSIQEVEFLVSAQNTSLEVCSPNDLVYNLTYNTFLGFTDVTTFSTTGLPAGTSATFSPTTASADGTAVALTISGTGSVAPGNYPFNVVGTSGSITSQLQLNFDVFNNTLVTPTLTAPSNGATETETDVLLTWATDVNTVNYLVEIATDAGFSSILESNTVTAAMYTPTLLDIDTEYFWRVTPSNSCGAGTASSTFSFTTTSESCKEFASQDLPQTMSGSSAGTYESVINFGPNFVINDINVEVGITNGFTGSLDISLISPGGTEIDLSSGNGSASDNYVNTVFDQESTNMITNSVGPFTNTYQPEGDLSVLYGQMSGGNWTLRVVDNVSSFGGTFDLFELYFCVQGDIRLSTADQENPISNLSLYPNPSNGEFNLNFDTDGSNEVKLQLFDLAGRMVQEQNHTTTGTRFSEKVTFRGLAKGLYLLKIVNGSKLSTEKLVIE